jgi:hypothetical protein
MEPLPHNQQSGTAITLNCGPEDFEKFIRSLLGRPQTITNHFQGEFDLNREDLEQFHLLLIQRIQQQNKASLIQFTARVVYDDNSTVLVNDFGSFKSYNEPKPLRSVAVHLSWSFLVQFEDRKSPEKQEIDVSIVTGRVRSLLDNDEGWFVVPFHAEEGMIALRVSHTARSWASDIEALLTGHIKTLMHDRSKIRTWLSKHNERIGIGVFCFVMFGTLISMFFIGESVKKGEMAQAGVIEGMQGVEAKLAALSNLIAVGAWPRFAVYGVSFIFLVTLVSIGLGIWAGSFADSRSPAFLTLTRKTEEYRRRMLERSKNRFRMFLVSLTVSIATGVAGNWIFAYFIQGWRP